MGAKVRAAVTDSGGVPDGGMSPGVDNLLTILEACGAEDSAAAMREDYQAGALRYSHLKDRWPRTWSRSGPRCGSGAGRFRRNWTTSTRSSSRCPRTRERTRPGRCRKCERRPASPVNGPSIASPKMVQTLADRDGGHQGARPPGEIWYGFQEFFATLDDDAGLDRGLPGNR